MMMDLLFDPCTSSSPFSDAAGTSELFSDFDLPTPTLQKQLFQSNEMATLSEQEENITQMSEDSGFKSDFFETLIADLTARNNGALSPSLADLFDDFGDYPFPPSLAPPPVAEEEYAAPPNSTTCDVGTDPMVITTPAPVIITHPPQHLPRLGTATKVVHLTTTPASAIKRSTVHTAASSSQGTRQPSTFIQITSCVPSMPTFVIAPVPPQQPLLSAGCYTLQVQETTTPVVASTEINEGCSMDEEEFHDELGLPLTPSTESESADERISTSSTSSPSQHTSSNNIYIKASPTSSPSSHRHHPYGGSSNKTSSSSPPSMLTDLGKLPSTGPLLLTDEELKLIKQEGYQVPAKLPLSKTEEKVLKKIRRKIKNKISAQESRRKKKEYVDQLERQMAQMASENKVLKEKAVTMEKNHRTLMQELQSLRSMVGKGTTATGTVLMVLVVFFAVLFGIWSPIVNKSNDEFLRPSAAVSSNNQDTASSGGIRRGGAGVIASKASFEVKQEPHSYYSTNSYKSRVLLSFEDELHQHDNYGPYFPPSASQKQQRQNKWGNNGESYAPAYTYSNSVEKYMNKKIKVGSDKEDARSIHSSSRSNHSSCLKRPHSLMIEPSIVLSPLSDIPPTSFPSRSNHTSNYRINEKVVPSSNKLESETSAKPLKIIRVERTTPPIGNDTLKQQFQRSA